MIEVIDTALLLLVLVGLCLLLTRLRALGSELGDKLEGNRPAANALDESADSPRDNPHYWSEAQKAKHQHDYHETSATFEAQQIWRCTRCGDPVYRQLVKS